MNSSFFGFYAHAGFLLELYKLGIIPSQVSGASAGALVAGLYAAGLDPDYIIRLLLRKNLHRTFWELSFPKKLLRLFFNRSGATGVLSGSKFLELLQNEIGDMEIENCPTASLYLSVANMTRRKQELKTSGPLAKTILASCSVPGMFEAHTIDDHHYWDGGIANPAPFEHWLHDPEIGTIIVHLSINEPEIHSQGMDSKTKLWSGVGGAQQIINDEIIRMKIKMAKLAKKRLIVLKTVTPISGPTKMSLGPNNVMLGRKTVHKHHSLLSKLL